MAHKVKCLNCGQYFDIDTTKYIKPRTNRYAHAVCPSGEEVKEEKPQSVVPQEVSDHKKLYDYIQLLYGKDVNWALVTKQIKDYQSQYGYTLSGIYKTLRYWHEIKQNPVNDDKSHGGLGIVPFVYNDASEYYYNLFLIEEANKELTFEHNKHAIKIKAPIAKPLKRRLFNLEDEEE